MADEAHNQRRRSIVSTHNEVIFNEMRYINLCFTYLLTYLQLICASRFSPFLPFPFLHSHFLLLIRTPSSNAVTGRRVWGLYALPAGSDNPAAILNLVH